MDTPILNKIKEMKNREHISFHTPGHKGKNTIVDWKEYIPFADLTEIGDLDNLHEPKGIIKESQARTSRIFGAKETIYSVNGTTGGLYIALGGLTRPNDKVLIQRNSHKAVYNGCILNRLDIEYIEPGLEEGILLEVEASDIEEKLKNDKDIKVVVITSPNYYGISSDLEKIAKIVKKYDRYLLVDEAHGSHLVFSDRLGKSALESGADIVVQSTHKTLPSFTQTSMIHIGTDRVDLDRVREMSNLYQTTSPSYLFMLSLELAGEYMAREGKIKLEKNIDIIEKWIDKSRGLDGLHIYERKNKDISKILFSIDGFSGPELEEIFRKDGIFLEMSDERYALALSTVMNDREDFDILFNKMISLAKGQNEREEYFVSRKNYDLKVKYPIYEAFYREGKKLRLEDSVGLVSKSFVIPYPPGIPILVAGEYISMDVVKDIEFLLDKGVEVMGIFGDDEKLIEVII